jgi:hypothetical protein
MIPVSPVDNKPVALDIVDGGASQRIRVSSNKIGWLHAKSDQPGAKYDIVIKDSMGRVRVTKLQCGNDTDRYGELVNIDTRLGEEMEIVVQNAKGVKNLQLFVN